MNRRNVISIVAATLMLPMGLIAAPSNGRPSRPSCKDCKKCGRACKCECSKGCKCKPGCCKQGESKPKAPQKPRGFDGRAPSFRPPNSRPPSGFDRRTPGFGPPSHGRPPQGRPYHNKESRFEKDEARHLPSSKHNPTNYEIMMRRFDKNKDGKIQAEEKKAAQNWFRERASLWQK